METIVSLVPYGYELTAANIVIPLLFFACGFKRVLPVAMMLLVFMVIAEACLFLNTFGNPPPGLAPIAQPFAEFMFINILLLGLWAGAAFLLGAAANLLYRKVMVRLHS